MGECFDWNTEECVVIRPQPAIAIQGDKNGDLLVRQEGAPLYGSDDQFLDVRHESILTVCRAMLREGGLHRYMIVEVDEIGLVGCDGNEMAVPAGDLEKLDRIAEEMRLERNEGRPARSRPIPAAAQPRPRDPKAAERKRRQRAKQRDIADVTPPRPRDIVTATVTTAPRLPRELDLLQTGGAKQPAG